MDQPAVLQGVKHSTTRRQQERKIGEEDRKQRWDRPVQWAANRTTSMYNRYSLTYPTIEIDRTCVLREL